MYAKLDLKIYKTRKYRVHSYLVPADSHLHILVTLGVHVVSPDKDALLASGDSKGADASHNIAHHLAGLEHVDEPAVLGLQLAVPVHLCVVKLESAGVLGNLDLHVVGTSQNLVLEGSELGLGSDIVDLVDDGSDVGGLVQDDLGDHLLVGDITLAKVHVGWTDVRTC